VQVEDVEAQQRSPTPYDSGRWSKVDQCGNGEKYRRHRHRLREKIAFGMKIFLATVDSRVCQCGFVLIHMFLLQFQDGVDIVTSFAMEIGE
jgi:hypothetical protein